MPQHVNIFIAAVSEDKALKEDLKEHLTPLRRKKFISIWDETTIAPGEEWAMKKKEYLQKAQIILLLISSDFLASDYMYNTAVKTALLRHQLGEVRVIPVILRSCLWESETDLAALQPLPANRRPVVSNHWQDEDDALTKIATGIQNLVSQLLLTQHPNYSIPKTTSTSQPIAIPTIKKEEASDVHDDAFSTFIALGVLILLLIMALIAVVNLTEEGNTDVTSVERKVIIISSRDGTGFWYNRNLSENLFSNRHISGSEVNIRNLEENQSIL